MKWTEKIFLLVAIIFSNLVYAQKPREIQVDNEPPLWEEPAVIIALIVVPVILLIFGIIWYKRRQRKFHDIKDQIKDSE